ncbi:MAG TPA: dTDP-4-dehydrorhamnose 3,5-epimerase family protein [Anaeromyxobacteraceae bacterium]|jgi:dTDP-4-dehydrorhamnose 3,5-epimerase|nr:dTDP-4-dehydrorhamnose 3,5-epimerase family protein [Anaeromyxobacteraceae bacterium]
MIEGVWVKPLRQMCDERGKVMHMLRVDAPEFEAFGEIYFSVVYPGAIKAWHLHKEMALNYAVPVGRVKLVLFDGREGSPTRGELMEVFTGPDDYKLVHVPPGVWNGFKGVGTEAALVANCASVPHRPDEIVRMDPFSSEIPYDWAIRHG